MATPEKSTFNLKRHSEKPLPTSGFRKAPYTIPENEEGENDESRSISHGGDETPSVSNYGHNPMNIDTFGKDPNESDNYGAMTPERKLYDYTPQKRVEKEDDNYFSFQDKETMTPEEQFEDFKERYLGPIGTKTVPQFQTDKIVPQRKIRYKKKVSIVCHFWNINKEIKVISNVFYFCSRNFQKLLTYERNFYTLSKFTIIVNF